MPHPMKKFISISVFMSLFLFGACTSSYEADYKPSFAFSYVEHRHFDDTKTMDTVSFYLDEASGRYVFDTVACYDTLTFYTLLVGYANILTGFTVNDTTNGVYISFADTNVLHAVTMKPTDFKALNLAFKYGYTSIPVELQCVPRKAGDADFRFEVRSDSKYSPTSILMRLPAR